LRIQTLSFRLNRAAVSRKSLGPEQESPNSKIMLEIIGTLIIGLIVGALAKLIVPGKDPGGCIVTIIIGIAGSFIAFYIEKALGWRFGPPGSLQPVGFLPSLGGAILLLLIYHLLRRKR
jgi:uncharacterized membrane protein YeaQ/YmgE (transglycosylase-associated protein family)